MELEDIESDNDMGLESMSDHSSRSGGPPCVFAGGSGAPGDGGPPCGFAGGEGSESERTVVSDATSRSEHILLRSGSSPDSGGSSNGMSLEEIDGEQSAFGLPDCDAEALAPSTWRPGENCGQWIRRGLNGFGVQAQVLICNVYLNVRRMPAALAQTVLRTLLPGSHASRNFADRVSAQLLGLSHGAARSVYDRLSAREWQPEPPESEPPGVIVGGSPLSGLDAMKVRVREILAICHSGRPDSDYPLAMQRLRLYGLPVGDRLCSRKFVEQVELLAATAARAEAARRLKAKSPSLGVCSDISIIWDGVSIGARNFSRYESLCLAGVVFMDWSSGTPKGTREQPLTRSCLLVAPSAGQQHTGQEQANLLLSALADHPAHLTKTQLQARLSAIGSDGAATKGGPSSMHSSTAGSETMWQAVHERAPAIVEWDLFHRVDLGTTKAIAASPAALEVFDVARVLGQLFGVGDGRVIFRASAAAVGARHLRVPDQSGTRKAVALARTVERLLQSLRTYQAGLHARRGQAEGHRRGAQSKTHLVSVGRRVTALNFVAFVVALSDVLRARVVPLAMRSQAVSGASWEMDSMCQRTLRHLNADLQVLRVLRRWVFVSALLQQYLGDLDLRRFWFALVSHFRKPFPTLVAAAYMLLHRQEYGGCQLSLVRDGLTAGFHYLSPKCQCASMRARPSNRPRLVEFRLGARVVRCPEWVGHSVYDPAEWKKTGFIGPRFVRVQKESSPPLGLAGARARFRQGVAPCRCVVPSVLPAASEDVLSALSEAMNFLESLIYHLRAYTVGSVGVPDATRAALDNAHVCWDWNRLLTKVPRETHYKAFFGLYEALLPALRHTAWPPETSFPWVQHTWPKLRGHNGAFDQYKRLMQRVRRAATKHDWRSQQSFVVEPVYTTILAASLGVRLSCMEQPARECILHLVAVFVGPDARGGIARASAFEADVNALAAVGHGRSMQRARGRRRQQVYRGGTFASLAMPRTAGRLVRVSRSPGDAAEEQIAATLLSDPTFAAPAPDDQSMGHCWHALRVYMRSRMMKAPESGCERWGSLLHSLWDSVSGWGPDRMVSRLLIREAGFDGVSPDHEDIVHELAVALDGWMGKSAIMRRSRVPRNDRRDVAENFVVRRQLRENPIFRQDWRNAAQPCELLPTAAHAVSEAVRLGRGGALQALPVFAEDVRSTRRGRTQSVVGEALAQFMQSEQGRQWQEDRKAIFGGDAPM